MTLEKSKAHQRWYKAMFLLPTILKLIISLRFPPHIYIYITYIYIYVISQITVYTALQHQESDNNIGLCYTEVFTFERNNSSNMKPKYCYIPKLIVL